MEEGRGRTRCDEFVEAGYEGCPAAYHCHGEDHAGEDAAVHSHEVGEFGVFFEISWSDLLSTV